MPIALNRKPSQRASQQLFLFLLLRLAACYLVTTYQVYLAIYLSSPIQRAANNQKNNIHSRLVRFSLLRASVTHSYLVSWPIHQHRQLWFRADGLLASFDVEVALPPSRYPIVQPVCQTNKIERLNVRSVSRENKMTVRTKACTSVRQATISSLGALVRMRRRRERKLVSHRYIATFRLNPPCEI
ncbi:hypothetical protein F4861DRAFT_192159 [Xylaria intraflava]|nr:hypothetical protein F4861DRAFT_192159 [Xylaria intraflava]